MRSNLGKTRPACNAQIQCNGARRPRQRHRRGSAHLEVVMTTAVMLPVAGLLFFLGIRMCRYAFEIISGLVGWPLL